MLLGVVVVSWPAAARADLMRDADALLASWKRSGGEGRRVATLFLDAGDARVVALGDVAAPEQGCLEVVALAERQLSFTLSAPSALPFADVEPIRRESRAGVAELEDCGDGELASRRVEIRMGGARGAVELLVVSRRASIAPVERILRDRALGPAAPESELGQPLVLAPVSERAARAERMARVDRARSVVTVRTQAGERGNGALILGIAEGCHRVSVLAEAAQSGAAVDVDADVRLAAEDVLLRRDRSHAPDARLDFCLGESSRVELRFAGAGGPVAMTVLDAYWPMPKGVPSMWGPRARAGMAWALHRRNAPAVVAQPVHQTLGSGGVTVVPVEVEGGACYLAALALARGQANAARLTVRVGGVTRYDDGSDEPVAAAVSFCAPESEATARMQVELRAESASWVLVLWHMRGSGG
jgi:hypothetical protein